MAERERKKEGKKGKRGTKTKLVKIREQERNDLIQREREKPRRIHYIRRIPSHLKSNYIINRIQSSSCAIYLKVTNYTDTYRGR